MGACDERVGPRGPRGFQGEKGETGASGVEGREGRRGPVGLTGLTGAQGEHGNDGAKGDKGDTGLQGPAGIPGRDGDEGAMGPKGANGLDGVDGEKGGPGAQGPTGATGQKGDTGDTGTAGTDGRYILGSYVSLTGIGNSDATGDETVLFTQAVTGNTLANDGEELEFILDTEYQQNDLVNLIFELDPANRYTYAYQNTENDIRFIKVIVTRVNSTSQLWSIQDVCKNALNNIAIKTVETFTTSFDLTRPMTFNLLADNVALGANQVLLKKCSMYLNKLQ